jgi:two-component system NtrC family sensor kinase
MPGVPHERNGMADGARLLIVDDEPANVHLLERLLAHAGYPHLRSTTDSRQVVPLFKDFGPDLVLLDLVMPHRDGFAVMAELAPLIPAGDYRPILVLTADVNPETRRRALAAGANDFLTKPFDATEVLLRIANLLQTRRLTLALKAHNERLEEQVRERTERLLQTEKVATMGSLLAGVAHELNNPLTIIIGSAALLQRSLPPPSTSTQVDRIATAAQRCVRVIRNFLAMARRWPPERTHVALNPMVQETVEFLAYELRTTDVEVQIDSAEDLPLLWADPHQLQQVLVNLVVNAQHALRDGPPPRALAITTHFDRARERAVLVVSDNGPGVPPEIQARIFEPFFTTKPLGTGTGLGLSLCQSIVENHGGTIRIDSRPGAGATFTVELPVGAPPAAGRDTGPREAEPAVRGQKVLVVDDEPGVAAMLAEMLTADGHEVATADNGVSALARLRDEACDLILSDSGMPGLDGPGLYREIERLYPHLVRRFIVLSGDTLNPRTAEFFEAVGALRVNKPFTLDQVREAVRRAVRDLPASP